MESYPNIYTAFRLSLSSVLGTIFQTFEGTLFDILEILSPPFLLGGLIEISNEMKRIKSKKEKRKIFNQNLKKI